VVAPQLPSSITGFGQYTRMATLDVSNYPDLFA